MEESVSIVAGAVTEHERKDKMKVKRTIKIEKPEKYEVGDIIKFK